MVSSPSRSFYAAVMAIGVSTASLAAPSALANEFADMVHTDRVFTMEVQARPITDPESMDSRVIEDITCSDLSTKPKKVGSGATEQRPSMTKNFVLKFDPLVGDYTSKATEKSTQFSGEIGHVGKFEHPGDPHQLSLALAEVIDGRALRRGNRLNELEEKAQRLREIASSTLSQEDRDAAAEAEREAEEAQGYEIPKLNEKHGKRFVFTVPLDDTRYDQAMAAFLNCVKPDFWPEGFTISDIWDVQDNGDMMLNASAIRGVKNPPRVDPEL